MSDACLWLDSNIAWTAAKVREIAELAKRKGVKVVIPAQVYLERYRERLEKLGDQFSRERFDSVIDQMGVDIVETRLDRVKAGEWAVILNRRYPTEDAWKRAKLSAVKATLPDEGAIKARRVPMTTDWLIALDVEAQGAFVAVADKGEEWSALRATIPKRALSYEETLEWLSSQADVEPHAS